MKDTRWVLTPREYADVQKKFETLVEISSVDSLDFPSGLLIPIDNFGDNLRLRLMRGETVTVRLDVDK